MAYISSGQVMSKRSIWRLSIFSDIFWAILNFLGLFFTTLFSLEATDSYGRRRPAKQSGPGGPGKPGGGGPGNGRGGGGGGGGGESRGDGGDRPTGRRIWGLDNVRGLQHYVPAPACGPCAGGSCG